MTDNNQAKKKILLTLSGISLLFFIFISFVFNKFLLKREFSEVLQMKKAIWIQVLLGSGFSLITIMIALFIISLPFMKETKTLFRNLLKPLEFSLPDIIFLSICAGLGEEILFRGSLQYILGIWPTALLFVALHGYLNPWNWKLSIYGVYMVALAAGLGYLYDYIGLFSAVTAHFLFDFIMIIVIVR